ncbi:hypothetical protein HMPREF0020_02238, partial [Acinetobacter baumannii 6013113]
IKPFKKRNLYLFKYEYLIFLIQSLLLVLKYYANMKLEIFPNRYFLFQV